MLPKEQFEEMEHSEHYDAAITSLKYAIESDITPRKQISFLHAQVSATLAIYKLLLSELKGNELWRKAMIENTEV